MLKSFAGSKQRLPGSGDFEMAMEILKSHRHTVISFFWEIVNLFLPFCYII